MAAGSSATSPATPRQAKPTSRRERARLSAGAALAGLLLAASGAIADPGAGFDPITVSARAIPNFQAGNSQTKFGTLIFRGGLVLTSPDPRFGSLSGLAYAPDGRLIGISDTGFWFSGRLQTEGDRPTGISDAGIASLRDEAGKAITGKIRGDAESLRIGSEAGRATAYVSFEGRTVVRRYYTPPDFAEARGALVPLPKTIGRLPYNQGLEAIALPAAGSPLGGALVLIAERALDKAGNHRGFIVGGKMQGEFTIRRSDEYDVTDAAFLPDGDLLVLERRFNYSSGVAMRLRRFAGADIRPGRLIDGPVQFDANMRYDIDNMEGLAVSTGAGGETLVDLVSDDNQNHFIQRTILLRFALTGGPVAPSPISTLPEDAASAKTVPLPKPRPTL